MSKTIFMNMENQIFRGNLLDVGLHNEGIIYNIYKEFNDNVNVEYISGKEEEQSIKKEYYDNCILLFSFNKLWFNLKKRNFIKDIYNYLKEDGLLHIWDIDKGYVKIFNGYIKILIPGGKIKNIRIRDFNVLKNNSKENTVKLLHEYFQILDLKNSDGLYYVKAQKKKVI